MDDETELETTISSTTSRRYTYLSEHVILFHLIGLSSLNKLIGVLLGGFSIFKDGVGGTNLRRLLRVMFDPTAERREGVAGCDVVASWLSGQSSEEELSE